MMHRRRAARTHRDTTRVIRTTKPTLMDRLRGRPQHTTVTTTSTGGGGGAVAPRSRRHHHHHRRREPAVVGGVGGGVQQRRPSLGDRISGALMRLKGSLTGRPGLKAAGTRRERGTDGRGMRRGRRAY